MTLMGGLALISVVFLTSTLSGVFGMAGGLVLLWFLLIMFPAGTAMAVHGVIQLTSNGSRAWLSRRFIVWRIVMLMTLGVLIAAGLLLLFSYSPNAATVSLFIGLMPILVWIPKRWFHLDANRASHALGCGIAAGSLTIAAGVSGPLIDIFFVRSQMDRRQVVATKAMIQVVAHSIKILFYLGAAMALSTSEWGIVLLATPFAIFGTHTGNRILQRLTDANFRTWTRWIVTGIGIFYLLQGLFLLTR
ncbi:sulfite exporter TauE/SafE family protein [Vreelandella venusta]|uniref:sulfite exporter TauE/SafE family protein n=1 Tax=Vreelandella venusta TaxID=44935 RepID=UPI0018DA9791|nr:sulfite exporter TauE/SafE family protein [Halomonas venusta]QPI63674.1 sulfite exporter TauE/SafE family protein [Halomonas venusta]WAM55188.1 sulfite exporter TauE/SafE family protein [Halomonas venusta]